MSLHYSSLTLPKQLSTKGRLYTGPIVNAYSRSSIATIPSAVENILFKKPNRLTSLNRNCFEVQGESIKLSFNNGVISNNYNQLKTTTSDLIFIKQKEHHVKPSERFNYNNIQKYYPGPGEYNPIHNPKSLRYNSLFELPQCQTESWEINPGPGSYNISSAIKTNVYISPCSRFQKKRIEEHKTQVSPGSYDVSSDFGSKEKESSFFKKEISKKKGDVIMKFVDFHENIYQKNETKPWKDKKVKGKVRNFKDIKEEIIKSKTKLNNDLIIKQNIETKTPKEKNINNNSFIYIKKIKGTNINLSSKNNNLLKHNYVPGPCYYNQPLMQKKIFNANMNHNWLGQ